MKKHHLALLPFFYLTTLSPAQFLAATIPIEKESDWIEKTDPPILSPEKSLKTIQVPQDFKIELVASEPLINDPVAISWDEDGRLWVVEMWNYLSEEDTPKNSTPNGRVVILEDTNKDGQMDKSFVFLDHLRMPQAISFVKDGVLISDPPKLLYCQDKNEDNICDTKTTISNYAAKGKYWDTENGLIYGIDNWLYSANSRQRIKFNGDKITRSKNPNDGYWGITNDSYGRLYYTKDSEWLHSDYLPWKESNRNPNYSSHAGLSEKIVHTNTIFTNQQNPLNKQNLDLRSSNKQNTEVPLTTAQGPSIYRGDTYPIKYKENAFVCAPAQNAVAYFNLTQKAGSIKIEGEQILQKAPDWDQAVFIGSSDQRFRPVNTSVGPDGNLYIVDMYRNKFHQLSNTPKIDAKSGLGRIYRLVHRESSSKSFEVPRMSKMDSADLVPYLDHPNGWWRDTAQRIIVERRANTKATINKLYQLLENGSELGKIHALWTLHGLASYEYRTFETSQKDESPWVRIHGLRTGKKQLRSLSTKDQQFIKDALTSPHEALRLQAVQSLFFLKDSTFKSISIKSIHLNDLSKAYFQEAIVSSLSKNEVEFISELDEPAYSDKNEYISLIQKLTTAIAKNERTEDLYRLKLDFENEWIDIGIIAGLNQVLNDSPSYTPLIGTTVSNQKNILIDALLGTKLAKINSDQTVN